MSETVRPLDVLIVGCGNIAGGFDESRPAGEPPLTHAGAFARDPRFRLAACIEPDDGRRARFMARWGVPQGHAGFDALEGSRFDIVSICSPTALHAKHVEAALRLGPKLIFCEKPLAPALADAERLVGRCEAEGVLLAVNHSRRWDPAVTALRDELRAGAWGELRSAVGHYNKGLLNNGSHMIDLLHFLLGGDLELVCAGPAAADFFEEDPTIPALLRGAGGVAVHLAAADARDYALFELELVASEAVIAMEEGGMSWRVRRAEDSRRFAGYRTPGLEERRAGDYGRAMANAVASIYEAVASAAALACTGRDALAAQRLCDQIRKASERP